MAPAASKPVLRSLHRPIRASSTTNLDRALRAFELTPLGTEQIFEERDSVERHDQTPTGFEHPKLFRGNWFDLGQRVNGARTRITLKSPATASDLKRPLQACRLRHQPLAHRQSYAAYRKYGASGHQVNA